MPEGQITNPLGAFQGVTDFTTYTNGTSTAVGQDLAYSREVHQYRANATITKYDWVMLVAATTTVPLSVTPVTGNTLLVSLAGIGVALEPASAGDLVNVCVEGPTLANVGTATVVGLGDLCVRNGSATGACALTATAGQDAALIAGTVWGFVLGTEVGTLNLAPVYVHKM